MNGQPESRGRIPGRRLQAWAKILLLAAAPVIITGMIAAFHAFRTVEFGLREHRCREYCELSDECEERRSIPLQPINTYSNVGYLLAGAAILFRQRSLVALTFAVAMTTLFTGSAWFHAALTKAAQQADVAGMFATASFVAAYAVVKTHNINPYGIATIATIVMMAPLAIFGDELGSMRVVSVAAGVVVVHMVLAVARDRQRPGPVLLILGLFSGGLLVRQLGLAHVLCNPDSWFQLHALWHLLTAIGLYHLFWFFHDMPRAPISSG